MKRKRVVVVVDNDLAHDARVRRQAQSLGQHGWDVLVVSRGGTRTSVSRMGGVVVVSVAAGLPNQSARFWRRVVAAVWRKLRIQLVAWGMVRRLRPNVVHVHDIDVLPVSSVAASLNTVPIVYDAHELHAAREEFGILQRPVAWLEKFLIRRVAVVTAPTGMRCDWLKDFYAIPRPVVIPNFPIRTSPPRTERIRQALKIPGDRMIFLYQGVLHEGRGLHNMVRALHEVGGAVLVFLGSGRQEASLKALVEELGLEERVRFQPKVPMDELPEWTASADVGLQLLRNTSVNHYTTDSNKIYEYIMAGLAVIASDFPEIRQIVEDSGAGELVDPENVAEIAAAMNRMVADPERVRRFRQAAVDSRDDYTWESVEHRLVNLFDDVRKVHES